MTTPSLLSRGTRRSGAQVSKTAKAGQPLCYIHNRQSSASPHPPHRSLRECEVVFHIDITQCGHFAINVFSRAIQACHDKYSRGAPHDRNIIPALRDEQYSFVRVKLVRGVLHVHHRAKICCGAAVALEGISNQLPVGGFHLRLDCVAAGITGDQPDHKTIER